MIESLACRTLDITDAFPEGMRQLYEPVKRKKVDCPITNGKSAMAWLKANYSARCRPFRLNAGRLEQYHCFRIDGAWVEEWLPCTVANFVHGVRSLWCNEQYFDLPYYPW